MRTWLGVMAVGTSFACQMGASPQDSAQRNDPHSPSSAIQLAVTLTELSQGLTPAGIPEQFAIAASRLPSAAESVDVTWEALDGDPTADLRQGSGSLTAAADGIAISIVLNAAGRPPTAAWAMTGTFAGGTMGGSFLDRLFSPRAGKFTAEIQ
jgi:hypothetical protein